MLVVDLRFAILAEVVVSAGETLVSDTNDWLDEAATTFLLVINVISLNFLFFVSIFYCLK